MKSFWKTIVLSVLIVNGLAGGAIYVYRRSLERRVQDSEWTIKQIVERGRGELPPGFFAEALGLSQDRPTPWDLFQEKEAVERLEKFAFLDNVRVRKVEPNCLVVDYTLRTPLAMVGG